MAYGDGSIVRRGDGRLEVRVLVGGRVQYDHVPARLVRADPAAAMALAQAKRRSLALMRPDAFALAAPTVADYLESWMSSLERSRSRRMAPATLLGYRQIIDRRIAPALGRRRLDRLTEQHVQAWVDSLDASPQTVRNCRAVLRRALNAAVAQRLVPRNVAAGRAVEMPRVAEFQAAPLTLGEVRTLLAATRDDRYGALWALAVDTGWREGELLGLARDDVDEDAGTATLRHQLRRVRGRGRPAKGERREADWEYAPTKRPRQLATVSLSPSTCDAVRRHRLRTASERKPGDRWFGLLFTSPTGLPLGGSEALREFKAACGRAGIAERRLHDLRVTSATVLRELGVPEDVRMSRLGHATTDMARHYAKARVGSDRGAADALGEALG